MNRYTEKNINNFWLLFVLAIFFVFTISVEAAGPLKRIKFAMTAPKGSIYHRVIQELGEEWRLAQGNNLKFTIYTDGIQGTEADMVRRMRVGQLNGAMLTIVGLSAIDDSVAVLQKFPMFFRSWDEFDHVREKVRPILEKRLLEKGFVALTWGEGGWIQFFSNRPMIMPDDFRQTKIFAWAGDPEMINTMKKVGYHPVVLELTDILPGLQTGMIDAVSAVPLFALISQFDRVAPYMLRINWAPLVGATVITKKTWDAISPSVREVVTRESARAEKEFRIHRNTLDDESINALQKRGLNVQPYGPEVELAWNEVAKQTYPLIRGTSVPAEMFDLVQQILVDYRRQGK